MYLYTNVKYTINDITKLYITLILTLIIYNICSQVKIYSFYLMCSSLFHNNSCLFSISCLELLKWLTSFKFFKSISFFAIPLNQPVFIIQNENISLVEWIPFAVHLDQSGSSFALDLEQAAIVQFICFDFIESTCNATFLVYNTIGKVTHEFFTFMMLSLTKLNWLTTKPVVQMCGPNCCTTTFIDFLGYNIQETVTMKKDFPPKTMVQKLWS